MKCNKCKEYYYTLSNCDQCKKNSCCNCISICKYSPIITNHQPLTNSLKIHNILCENCKDKCNICNINIILNTNNKITKKFPSEIVLTIREYI